MWNLPPFSLFLKLKQKHAHVLASTKKITLKESYIAQNMINSFNEQAVVYTYIYT